MTTLFNQITDAFVAVPYHPVLINIWGTYKGKQGSHDLLGYGAIIHQPYGRRRVCV